MAIDEPFQLLLTVDKRQGPQIAAFERQAIEGVKYGFTTTPQQFVKHRPAGGVEHHYLSVEHGFMVKFPQRGTQRPEGLVHVSAAGDELAMTGPYIGQGAKAVVLQLIHKSLIVERFAHRYQICWTERHAFLSFSLAFIEASGGVLLLCNHASSLGMGTVCLVRVSTSTVIS